MAEAYLKEQNKGLGPGFVVFGRVTSAGTLAKVGAQACGGAVATGRGESRARRASSSAKSGAKSV